MADGRMLKKKISLSRRLADLKSDSARMLYTWLIPHLDIEGRFSADPEVVKGQIVPRLKHLTPPKIEELLKDLASQELIVRYTDDGDLFLELRHFGQEQNLRKDREKESTIPCPTKDNIIDDLDEVPGELPEDSGLTPAQVKLREVKLSKDKCSFSFNTFWKEYPRKVSKQQAQKVFWRIDPDDELLDKMLNAIRIFKKTEGWQKEGGKFIPHAATWLSQERWDDEIQMNSEQAEDYT